MIPTFRCGHSGLVLPAISLGLWHTFGNTTNYSTQRDIIQKSFDMGIFHFDNANCYGPPDGEAEITLGRILKNDLSAHRDEIVVATKAGAPLGDAVYMSGGSRKHLFSQIDRSLRRLKLDYVDIFYHHRPDPDTDIEETAETLIDIVNCGKALYIGLSNYSAADLESMISILKTKGKRCVICQYKYSMLHLDYIDTGIMKVVHNNDIGSIAYSILAQGILTGKYLNGVPSDSRIATDGRYIKTEDLTISVKKKVLELEKIAKRRGQSLTQMALVWAKFTGQFSSVLIGVSQPNQIEENINALYKSNFSTSEINDIMIILNQENKIRE